MMCNAQEICIPISLISRVASNMRNHKLKGMDLHKSISNKMTSEKFKMIAVIFISTFVINNDVWLKENDNGLKLHVPYWKTISGLRRSRIT